METPFCIEVNGLQKHFRFSKRDPGMANSLKSLFHRTYETVKAVDGVSFNIGQGEIVGFLGPNGAGKTTTLKCLSGLLQPNAGSVMVLGHIPGKRSNVFLKNITLVMGQRNQLMWDLPAMESFLINQSIYNIPQKQFSETLEEMKELLNLEPLLNKQVRKLSLGERMKCELAASLLHRPGVLFLDEPTIGLDVTAQAAIRDFIKEYNKRYNATILLTSHYMADVTSLASRIIVIHHGTLLYDGDLRTLVEQKTTNKVIKLTLERNVPDHEFARLGEIEQRDGLDIRLSIPKESAKEIASRILSEFPVADISIEEPQVEDIIREIFNGGKTDAQDAKIL